MFGILKTALRLTKGYRLRFWESPYLKWRVETWSGIAAESLTPALFLEFTWKHRSELIRYLRWAANRGIPQR
ncbi:MAG TPA: hypothetical protein VNH18_07725 [Bryobacteraceae bacterium]|nr:hypothetical protein [Bryobacteraceae bacterium]